MISACLPDKKSTTNRVSSTIPNLKCLVYTASYNCALLDSDGGYKVRMNIEQFLGAAARRQIPTPQRLVITHWDQETTHRMETQVSDPIVVADESYYAACTFDFPNFDALIATATREVVLHGHVGDH